MKLNVIFVITVFLVSIFFWIGIFYCLLKVIKKVSVIYRLKSWTGFEQNETINNVNRLLLTINLFIDGANKTNIVIKKKIVTSMRFTHCNVNFIALREIVFTAVFVARYVFQQCPMKIFPFRGNEIQQLHRIRYMLTMLREQAIFNITNKVTFWWAL